MSGQGSVGETQSLRAQEVQEQARLGQLLDAAETDSYEVRELRLQWRRYQRQATELTETMEHWRESFAELQALELQPLLPNLAAFGAELDVRLAQIERMLTNQPPERHPAAIDLALDKARVGALSHFQRAALAVTRSRLQHLEPLTRSLFDSVGIIKGFGRAVAVADTPSPPRSGFVLDPDRLASLVRIMVIMWLAWLALIYVDSLPGGGGFVSLSCAVGMALAATPQLSVSRLFLPAVVSVLFASVVYIFVMPQLSSFLGRLPPEDPAPGSAERPPEQQVGRAVAAFGTAKSHGVIRGRR